MLSMTLELNAKYHAQVQDPNVDCDMDLPLRQEFADDVSPELAIYKQIYNVPNTVLSALRNINACDPPNDSVKEVLVQSHFTDQSTQAQKGQDHRGGMCQNVPELELDLGSMPFGPRISAFRWCIPRGVDPLDIKVIFNILALETMLQ